MNDPMLEELLTRLRTEVPDCGAALAVELASADVLALRADDDSPAVDAVPEVLRELFDATHALTSAMAPHDSSMTASLQEVIVLSRDRAYVCRALKARPGAVVAAVSDNLSNLGLLLATVRRAVAVSEETA